MEPATHEQGAIYPLPLDQIHVKTEANPRRHFGETDFQLLCDSIRDSGLIQPITVRPTDDGAFELICGERRIRAFKHLGLTEIPAYVRVCSDAEARKLALLENIRRVDLTPGEEALAARDLLDAHNGDRAATASALGWSERKLAARLQLLHCAIDVIDALAAGAITIGHAELLSGLPEANQLKSLPRIIEQKIDVPTLREQLHGFSIPLDKAIFDRAGCTGCPNNSDSQNDLFSNALSSGKCFNKSCFSEKSRQQIELKRTELRESFAVVALQTEKDPASHVPLAKFGTAGVGEAQFAACRTCQHFGALIEDRLNNATGTVQQPTCFNRGCNDAHRAAYQATLTPPAPDRDRASQRKKGAKSKPAPVAAKSKAKPAKKARPTVVGTPSAVTERIDTVYREAAAALAGRDETTSFALAVYAMAQGARSDGARQLLSERLGLKRSHTSDHTGIVRTLATRTVEELRAWLVEFAREALVRTDLLSHHAFKPVPIAKALVAQKSVDLRAHFTMSAEFLTAHTKSAIETILDESKFRTWFEAREDGKKRYQQLVGSKKDELIRGVMDAGFDFAGYVPSEVTGTGKPLHPVPKADTNVSQEVARAA